MTEVSKNHIQEIKFLQDMSYSADAISNNMKIPIEKICEILNYPNDIEGREKAHKDYNYLNHGEGEKIDRVESYILYLKEGDFEKWQPVCYMDNKSDEYLRLKEEADSIPKSNDPESETRRYWIRMRFQKYQETEWGKLKDNFLIHASNIPEWFELHERISHDKMLHFFI